MNPKANSSMDALDLRLGNIVKCAISNDNGVYHVLGFPEWTTEPVRPVLIDRCPKQVLGIDKLRPMPLTDEWFDRFEFSKDVWRQKVIFSGEGAKIKLSINSGVCFIHQQMEQYTSLNDLPELIMLLKKDGVADLDEKFRWIPKHSSVMIPRKIKFVHQLQNLCFDMSGQEITESPSSCHC